MIWPLIGILALSILFARLVTPVVGLLVGAGGALVWVFVSLRVTSKRPPLSRISLVLLIASVLVPFSLIPPIGGLLSADDLVMGIGAVLAVASLWKRRDEVRVPAFAWPLALLTVWALVAWMAGDRTLLALGRGPGRLALYFVILLAAMVWFREPEMRRFALAVLVVIAAVEAAFAIFSYFAPFQVEGHFIGIESIRAYDPIYQQAPGRAVGTLGLASNFLGAYMLIPAGIALGIGSLQRTWQRVLVWSVMYLLFFWALSLTYTRASLIAAVVSALAYFVWTRRSRMLPAFLVALITVVALTPIMSRFSLGNDRVRLALEALHIIKEHPVTGVGPGEYVPQGGTSGGTGSTDTPSSQPGVTPHNSFLLYASELGVPGGLLALIAALIPALAAFFVRARGPDWVLSVAVGVGLGGFLLQTMTNNLLQIPVVTIQFWIASGLGLALAASVGGKIGRSVVRPSVIE